MGVWYLDSDDEITDAVARLRNASDDHVVFVVPPGSRIATGRINIKLLHREAASRGLSLAIASPDAQVRAMAMSAGVLGLATAAEAQAALARGDTPPDVVEPSDEELSAAQVPAVVDPGAAARGPAFRWGGRRLVAAVVVVLGVAVVGVVASLQTLPTAEITLAPRTVSVGPLTVTITALTSVTEPDVASRQVPAIVVPIPLDVEGVFPASGSQVVEERARGEVVFSAPTGLDDEDAISEIPALTRVFTADGVEFRTTRTVQLRAADGGAPQAIVPIEAARPGPDGNVEAGAIDSVPSLTERSIHVSNPEATSGGRREETPVVTREDYDAAAVDLQNRLAGALAAYLRAPDDAPEGLTLFVETARPGPTSHEPPPDELVGTSAPDFRLAGSLAASVLAVDERLVDALAEAALLAEVPDGMAILPDAASVETADGVAEGEQIRFESTARGSAYQLIDADEVLARVAGLPVSEARAILENLGATTVSVWPEFLGDLPGDRNRIRLDVLEPDTTE